MAGRLNDEDGEVRGEAMIGLAQRKDPRALPAIRTELASEDLEGDWVFEAAELLAEPSLYEDILPWLNEDEDKDEDENYLNKKVIAALEACRPPGHPQNEI